MPRHGKTKWFIVEIHSKNVKCIVKVKGHSKRILTGQSGRSASEESVSDERSK